LFAGVDRAQDLVAERLLGDALDEIIGDIEIDVALEQGLANLVHAFANICLGNATAAAQVLERFAQAALKSFEHNRLSVSQLV
jgi:hypothetical protein